MRCDNSFTSESGTFTFYSEKLTRCQAKKKCKSLGQVLAPIRKKSDMRAIENLLKNNVQRHPDCFFDFNKFGTTYHVGLEVEFVGGTLVKEFSDGQKWDNCEEYVDFYHFREGRFRCPMAGWSPYPNEKIGVGQESWNCSPQHFPYICFSPAKTTVAAPEPLKTQQDSTETFHLPGAFAALSLIVNVVCVLVAISVKRKFSKIDRKMNAMNEENVN